MKLDRQRAVVAALDLLNTVGVDGLTMRALATALKVQAASLYYHFPSKQALLNDMADAIVRPAVENAVEDGDYRAVLPALAARFRTALLGYRDGARVFAGTYALRPNVLHLSEAALAVLLHAGFDEVRATHATFNLFYFVLGFVIEEQAFADQWGNAEKTVLFEEFDAATAQTHPAISRSLGAILDSDFDQRFAFGLEVYVNGLAATI